MTPGFSAELNASLTFLEGEQWGGIPGLTIRVNGTIPASNVASAKMQFRPTRDSSDTLAELSTADATISCTSVANWTFVVPAQMLSLLSLQAPYWWGFQVTNVAGAALTYLEGEQLVLPKSIY